MRTWWLGLLALMATMGPRGLAQADREILTPRPEILERGGLVLEGIHRETDDGYLRYYFANLGIGQGNEVEVARLDFEEGEDVTLLSTQWRYSSASPLMPGVTFGIRDLMDQDDKGFGRAFYAVVGQTVPMGRSGGSLYEYLGYGTGHLHGLWGGVEWRTQDKWRLVAEYDPLVNGVNAELRYELPAGFRLKAGLYKGDLALGVGFRR